MLFNMAGIETASANGTNNSKNEGHTVNFAKLDGEYYYFDASADSIINEKGFKPAFYFGMSWKEAFPTALHLPMNLQTDVLKQKKAFCLTAQT